MKKLHTEKEHLHHDKHQIYRLARLAGRDQKLFKEVCDTLSFYVAFNNREGFDMTYANSSLEYLMNMDEEAIIGLGFNRIKEISDKEVLQNAYECIQQYEARGDYENICSYLQRIEFRGEFGWYATHKTIFDEVSYLNCGYAIRDIGKPGEFLTDLLNEVFVVRNGWEKFASLSKRERELLQLVAKGYTSAELAEMLYLSQHTVKTHRKNLQRKLEIGSLAELVRFAQAFEMI